MSNLSSATSISTLVPNVIKQKKMVDAETSESFMNYQDAYSNENNKITINILITIIATSVLYFVFKKI